MKHSPMYKKQHTADSDQNIMALLNKENVFLPKVLKSCGILVARQENLLLVLLPYSVLLITIWAN
jgi:hypothetical protein